MHIRKTIKKKQIKTIFLMLLCTGGGYAVVVGKLLFRQQIIYYGKQNTHFTRTIKI